MSRKAIYITGAFALAGLISAASAQTVTPSPAASPAVSAPAAPKPSRLKLTREKLKEMRAKWSQNKSKLAACRKEVKAKGLAGDDRWFFIEDCMAKY